MIFSMLIDHNIKTLTTVVDVFSLNILRFLIFLKSTIRGMFFFSPRITTKAPLEILRMPSQPKNLQPLESNLESESNSSLVSTHDSHFKCSRIPIKLLNFLVPTSTVLLVIFFLVKANHCHLTHNNKTMNCVDTMVLEPLSRIQSNRKSACYQSKTFCLQRNQNWSPFDWHYLDFSILLLVGLVGIRFFTTNHSLRQTFLKHQHFFW